MEGLYAEQDRLDKKGSLKQTIDDVQRTVDLLTQAAESIDNNPDKAVLTVAQLQTRAKKSFDTLNDDLKEIRGSQNRFQKAMEKKFKDKPDKSIPSRYGDNIAPHATLVNRAIAMHFIREGSFDVASTFIREANEKPPIPELLNSPSPRAGNTASGAMTDGNGDPHSPDTRATLMENEDDVMTGVESKPADSWARDFAHGTTTSQNLQDQFGDMYYIVREIREHQNLDPAVQWARKHSEALEACGSTLEFELVRLQYIRIYLDSEAATGAGDMSDSVDALMTDDFADGYDSEEEDVRLARTVLAARNYARREFTGFGRRYDRDVFQLCGALPFLSDLRTSPYWDSHNKKSTAFNVIVGSADGGGASPAAIESAYQNIARSFTSEFCSLLGLSAQSPLYYAVTAGAMALPPLVKVHKAMENTHVSWESSNELPGETALPPAYQFHNIVVCPVMKHQASEADPPMRLPTCGHVLCRTSLAKLAKANVLTCPYCKSENLAGEAARVFI